MSAAALAADSLGKRYRLGERGAPYGSARDALARALSAPWRSLRQAARPAPSRNELWALKDVSFELEEGEVLGIIGRNGAGKSTLLKILSRITEPTEGRARVRGRVGSLLEIGTGFHPELTGRENIFLSGAILGMSRLEIRRRFDEIVAFSGVERFLDTPVKYYSSGMYMRLAFAVAAHLEPDVLIVDEVLAVGDAEFQKKCLGKMGRVAGEGRTVLFVSHDLVAVEGLCTRALLLDRGELMSEGAPSDVLRTYRSWQGDTAASVDLARADGRPNGMRAVLRKLQLRDAAGNVTSTVECGQPLTIELSYEHTEDIHAPAFAVLATTAHGARLFHLPSEVVGLLPARAPRKGTAACRIDTVPLLPGQYSLTLGCMSGPEQLDLINDACYFEVTPANFYGTGRLPLSSLGPVLVDASWTIAEAPAHEV